MRPRTTPLALLALLLAGCGGSSHHGSGSSSDPSVDTIGPQVALAWPARARDFAAPSAATAAVVTFPGGGPNGNDVSQVVARPDGAMAVTKSYQLGIAVHPGRHLLRVDFLADGASTGTPLATATVNVKVTGDGALRTLDGKSLGTVAYGSNVTGLTIDDGQTLEVGASSDLVVTATAAGGVVALTPGSVRFAVTSGAENLVVAGDGSITSVATGTATLTATADGVTSPAATVTVLPAPIAARTISVTSADFVATPDGTRLWLALPASANGNAVQSLDVASGALGTPIAVGGDPNLVAISDDGSTLYAGLQNVGAVRKIDLTSGTAGLQFTIPPTGFGGAGYATDIAVQPGHPSTISLCTQEFENSGNNGPEVFDDGVKRPNGLGIYQGTRLLWASAARIVAYDNSTTDDSLRDVAVDANGATQTRSVPSGLNSFSTSLVFVLDRLYDQSGAAFDAATLARVGAFALPTGTGGFGTTFYGPAVDTANAHAYFVELDGSTLRLLAYDTTTFSLLSNRRISNVAAPVSASGQRLSLLFVGGHLALRLSNQVVFLDNVSSL